MSIVPADHLALITSKSDTTKVWITVCAEALYHDVRKAIELYSTEFNAEGSPLLDPFLQGFLEMARIVSPIDLQRKKGPPAAATLALEASLKKIPV